MRGFSTIVLLVLTITVYGQSGQWKPFTLIVIQPDTAIINESLQPGKDSIVATQLKRYYRAVETLENLVNCIGCPRDSGETEQLKAELNLLKAHEPKAKKFRFFHVLSSYSTEVYNFYFNEYEPFSDIIEVPNQRTDLASLKALADSANADYVVFYSNVHTAENEGLPVLELTTSLYSREENKIILNKKTIGDSSSRGSMWTCNIDIVLTCLFINGVRTSTTEVAKVLRNRQTKQN